MTYHASENIVRLRGLPWTTKEDDVRMFLSACNIKAVHFTLTREGRATGEAYVELESAQDFDIALMKHKEHMKNRYIEVLKAKREEMNFVLQKSNKVRQLNESKNYVVKLRGLPFGCTSDDMKNFFEGLVIAPEGIVRPIDRTGRVTGEAFVKFLDKENTDYALEKHMKEIGNRYIEVFRSTDEECYRAQFPNGGGPSDDMFVHSHRPMNPSGIPSLLELIDDDDSPAPRRRTRERSPIPVVQSKKSAMVIGSATGNMVHMRGLPFKCTATDIVEFFQPIKVLNIMVLFDAKSGRSIGEADVEFLTHEDALEAMKRDKRHMDERYVDLFLDSIAPAFPPRAAESGTNGNGYDCSSVYQADPYGYDSSCMVQYPGYSSANASYYSGTATDYGYPAATGGYY